MKFNKTAIRSISATLVLAQLSLAMQPLMAATREDKGASSPMAQAQLKQMQALQRSMDEGKAAQAAAALSPADRASTNLARVEELVRDLRYLGEEGDEAGAATKSGQEQVRAIGQTTKAKVRSLTAEQKLQRESRRTALWSELKSLLAQQGQDQGAVRSEFGQTRKMLIERKLPAVILARHDEAVAKFEQRVAQFNQAATKAASGDEAALAQLTAFFDENPTKRRAAPVDPKNLPWRTPEPTKRMPAETQTAWFQNLYGREGTRLAQVGNSLAGLTFITPPDAGSAPTEADLAETPETQRTAAIVAKATELGNNPVAIQNWVRNNVEWVPTWGAIQSAEDTLNKKRGNAIDIASLEIALLRAAKIPARYQFGTIEVPADQVMNWVGGVSKPEAAQQLLGQGGIANRGLIEGGKISEIRMEHAWVQAYVNWVPSRGAKQGSATQHPNPLAQRNAWVPLDPSFKQYRYEPKVDFLGLAPLDVKQILSNAAKDSSLDPATGALQNFSANSVASDIESYKDRLVDIVKDRYPNGDVGLVVGRKILPVWTSATLLGQPTTKVISQVMSLARLTDAQVHYVTLRMYASELDRAMGSPSVEYKLPLHQASKKLAVTYVPATASDQAVIDSAGQGKGMLPAYLISMQGQIRLDGSVAKTLPVASMGTPQYWAVQFDDPSGGGSGEYDFKAEGAVGDEIVFGFDAGGVDGKQIADRMARVPNQTASETLFLTALNYWGLTDAMHAIIAANVDVVAIRLPSVGMFAQPVQIQYQWGVASRGHYAGRMMDVRKSVVANVQSGGGLSVGFAAASGNVDSFLEGVTFDLLFGHGVGASASAVSVLSAANKQGLRIFHVDSSNYTSAAAQLSALPASDRALVDEAIAQGKEVLLPERSVQLGNWKGTGLIITDPDTGAGAYLINGAANGGSEDPCSKDPERQPQPAPVPDLGFLGKLFFALIMIVLAAAVVACVIGTLGICGGGLAPVVAAVGGLFLTTEAMAQSINFVPVRALNGYGYYAWSSTFGKIYGKWFDVAADAMVPTCDPGTRAALQSAKNLACGQPRSCGKEPCPDYQLKINNGVACAAARIEVMQKCYPTGPGTFGDAAHINELGEVMKVLGHCMCMAGVGACPVQAGP